jgi:hypothetical protein
MEDFLQVGEHTYNSFNKLFENEEDIDITIEVIANGDFMYPQTIPSGRNVTLKLNSHTVTTTHTITNNSPIIIKDDLVEEDGEQIYKGTLNCKNGTVLSQTGNLTLNGGNIIDSSGAYETPSILMNNGKLTINKGKVDNYGGMTIKLKSSSSIEVNGGVINQTSSTAIYCESSNAITINDGLISGVKNVIYNCTTTMEGGKVTGNNGVISGGTFTLNDGFVEGKSTWETTSTVTPSTAYINGGKITSGATGTGTYGGDSSACLNAATATVTGGTFECAHTGIWARWLTMSGGTIKAEKYGIRTLMRGGYDGTYYKRTITGGTIEGGVYGIYHELDNLVIGTKDGTIDETAPVIIGGTYGVYKGSGDISFYDGIIKGLTDAINKTYENIEDASQIKVGVETKTADEEEVQYTTHNLIYEYEFITNTTQNKNYKNFNDAILEANNNDKFEVFKPVDVYKEFTIDKNITIDLKGNKITLARIATIDEGAVVTIKDTGETPKGFDTLLYNKLIINNGTLTLQDIKFKTYYANDYLIVNNGTLTMNNCTLNGEYGVSSAEGSTLNINGGIIDVNKLDISNSGNLTLTGGTYNVDTSTYGTVYFLVTGGESTNTITDITTNGGVSISANSVGTITTSTIKSNSANSGKLTITDTDYIQTERGCGAVISNSGEFLMTGGEFTISNAKDCNSCKNAFINNSGKMKITDTPITFSDSELGGKVGIYTNSSQSLELENLNITANLTANMYNSFSIVSVAGGEFKSNKVNMSSNVNVPYVNSNLYGISISGGEANLKETDITVNAINSYGMYLSGGTINMINDNEFKVTGTNTFGAYFDGGTLYMATNNNALKSTGSTSYGAYINTATGKLLLGEREEVGTPNYGTENADVSTTDPYIEAIGSSTGYGIYNTNGYYEFGDGKVLGSTKARNGKASEVEYLWEITEYTDEETGYQYCILEFMDE